ncbi:MAG: regulatory protein RecX [Alteromonadaceae bacterium]|nr:regulatory protein RecX [Alteromonadaceae bacterium]
MENTTKIRHQITHMLSRREHSQKECVDKLLQKGFAEDEIWNVLSQFVAKDLQSDARFVYHFIRHSMHKGQGWFRIKQGIKAHHIEPSMVDEALAELEPDWFELAYQVKVKRFGEAIAQDSKEQQKQMRFLQYRGFSMEEIQHATHYIHSGT